MDLRRQVLAQRKGRRRGAAPYDEKARQLACDHAIQARRQGRAWIAIARELGVSPITLRKRCRPAIKSGSPDVLMGVAGAT
jgi:DNA invertase Pin-like site-specific DNA recombinase